MEKSIDGFFLPVTPLRKGMELEDACHLLRRYRDWRRGDGVRSFTEAGFKTGEVAAALDVVLREVPVLICDNRSLRGRLRRCQIQRERFHSQLRRGRGHERVLGRDGESQ